MEILHFSDCSFTSNGGNPVPVSLFPMSKNATDESKTFNFNMNRSGGAIVSNNFLSAREDALIVTVLIESSTFTNNIADSFGGAIRLRQTRESVLRLCTFESNSVGPGKISGEGIGGAIQDLSESGGRTSITHSIFRNNNVMFQLSNDSMDGNNAILVRGGALAISNRNEIILKGNLFRDNAVCSQIDNLTLNVEALPLSFGKLS